MRIPEDDGKRIRLQQGKTLFYQIDISYKVDGMEGDFVADALSARVFNEKGYFILSPKYEYIYRAYALHEKSGKSHHREYLVAHADCYDAELFGRYCHFDLNGLMKQKGVA